MIDAAVATDTHYDRWISWAVAKRAAEKRHGHRAGATTYRILATAISFCREGALGDARRRFEEVLDRVESGSSAADCATNFLEEVASRETLDAITGVAAPARARPQPHFLYLYRISGAGGALNNAGLLHVFPENTKIDFINGWARQGCGAGHYVIRSYGGDRELDREWSFRLP